MVLGAKLCIHGAAAHCCWEKAGVGVVALQEYMSGNFFAPKRRKSQLSPLELRAFSSTRSQVPHEKRNLLNIAAECFLLCVIG